MASGRTSRPGHSLAVLVLAALTIVVVASRLGGPVRTVRSAVADAASPIRDLGGAVASPFGDVWDTMTESRKLKGRVRTLEKSLAEAQADRFRYEDAVRERNEMLRNAGIQVEFPAVDSRVVGRSPSNFEDTVVIDRGSSSGIKVGNPVVAGAGLVGTVESVSRTRSVVALLTEPGTQIGVRLSVSGEVGLARADRSGTLRVDFIEPTTKVAEGEILTTTGFENSGYPDRLVVGKVWKASVSEGDLQMRLIIRPLVDPKRLSFVKVLLWNEGDGVTAVDDDPGAPGADAPTGTRPGVAVTSTTAPATQTTRRG